MLCSTQTSKSGSNWLDRLRSNKGFPTTDDNLNLDHFLDNLTHHDPPPIQNPTESTRSNNQHHEVGETQWFGLINNVLSDLFVMDSPTSSTIKKKSSRKQANPKIYENASSFVRNDRNAPTNAASDKEESTVNLNVNVNREEGVDEEKELKGYSRSEVTVIDTSFEVWKFDKVVFRKKNVWKIRDKKGRSSWVSGAKKRKLSDSEGRNGSLVSKKRARALIQTKDGNEAGSRSPVDCGRKLRNENGHEACKGRDDDLSQSSRDRSPRRLKKSGSSVVLIKALPTNKKSGKTFSKQ